MFNKEFIFFHHISKTNEQTGFKQKPQMQRTCGRIIIGYETYNTLPSRGARQSSQTWANTSFFITVTSFQELDKEILHNP
jgi:hypothetical protein